MDEDERSEPMAQGFGTDYPGGTAQVPVWDPASPAAPARGPRIVPAVLAGIVTAVAATAAWYFVVALSGWQIGLLAIGVGFVVGYAMRLAAGGVGGIRLQIGAVVLTLLSMVAAEFLITRKFLGEYFVSQGDTSPLPMLFAPAEMVGIVADVVKADPMTLLFWAIALSAAWRVAKFTPEQAAAPPPAGTVPAV